MTTWFVTRHPGARDWAARRGVVVDRLVDHLDPDEVAAGDTVIGVLPVALAAAVCARGAHFVNLTLDLPPELRGRELDADTLERLGARLEGFEVWPAYVLGERVAARVQVCVVSEQLLPSLIAALQAPRPAKVYALASAAMAKRGLAARLADLLAAEGIACEIVPDLPEDAATLDAWTRALAQVLQRAHPGEPIALNATGGTKLMSLALVDAFRRWLPQAEIVYADTARGRLGSITHKTENALGSVLDIPTYLGACGAYLVGSASDAADWQARAAARAELSRWYAQQAGRLGAFFTQVNAMANLALDRHDEARLAAPQQSFRQPLRQPWLRAAEKARDAGLLELDADPCTIRFASAEAARYLRGGWLEEYAWHCARALKLEHVAAGAHVAWEGGNRGAAGKNELDLLLVHRNRMLVAECKTGRYGRDEDAGREQDVLNTLDSLGRHAAGALGRTLMLSAWKLGDPALARAGHYGITVLDGERLTRLPDELQRWMAAA